MASFQDAFSTLMSQPLPPESYHMDASFGEWVPAAVVGVVASLSVLVLSGVYSSGLPAYRKLTPAQKAEWDSRAFSTSHALFITAATIAFFRSKVFQDESLAKDDIVINRATPYSYSVFGLSLGYFLTDITMMSFWYPALGGAEYMIHHVAAVIAILSGLLSGNGHVFIMLVLVTEMTTPFVNLRWYLSVSGLRHSIWYTLNGCLLFVGWLIARVLLFLYLFRYMYLHRQELESLTVPQKGALFTLPPLFFLLNLYWFFRILLGTLKLMLGSKRKEA